MSAMLKSCASRLRAFLDRPAWNAIVFAFAVSAAVLAISEGHRVTAQLWAMIALGFLRELPLWSRTWPRIMLRWIPPFGAALWGLSTAQPFLVILGAIMLLGVIFGALADWFATLPEEDRL